MGKSAWLPANIILPGRFDLGESKKIESGIGQCSDLAFSKAATLFFEQVAYLHRLQGDRSWNRWICV